MIVKFNSKISEIVNRIKQMKCVFCGQPTSSIWYKDHTFRNCPKLTKIIEKNLRLGINGSYFPVCRYASKCWPEGTLMRKKLEKLEKQI